MIETILYAVALLVSLWGYFSFIGGMNFRKDPNAMEEHLPGRPARRTIGRKNEDISKAIIYIFSGYLVVCATIYGLLDYKDLLSVTILVLCSTVAFALTMGLFSPANRSLHAYVDLGGIAVTHFICSISAFLLIVSFFYGYSLDFKTGLGLSTMSLGAMMVWGVKPKNAKRRKKHEDGETF